MFVVGEGLHALGRSLWLLCQLHTKSQLATVFARLSRPLSTVRTAALPRRAQAGGESSGLD